MRTIILLLAIIHCLPASSQVEENKKWCRINCDASIHKENAELIYKFIQLDSIKDKLMSFQTKKFPIRFVYVNPKSDSVNTKEVTQAVAGLNNSFAKANFEFYIDEIGKLDQNLCIEDLSHNSDNIYDTFSGINDKPDVLTIYVMEYRDEFCDVTPTSISCAKVGGFSYILSDRTNNIVLSRFDLLDDKIVAHEMGHFFGLYHTFEQQLFGKDVFNSDDCYLVGDRLCDTPPDPGTVFEVYVNYTKCGMVGLESEKGHTYSPIIENYMSYYKPCYLKEYSFSDEQVMIMQLSSELPFRENLSRK